MPMRHFAVPCMLLTATLVSWPAHSAQAGPLLDWLFHKPSYGPAVPVGAPYPVTAGYTPAVPYGAGYAPYSTGYATHPVSNAYSGATPYAAGYTGYSGYTGYTPYGVAYPSTGYRWSTGNVQTQGSYPLPTYGTYYGNSNAVVGATGYGYLTQKPPNEVIAPGQAMMPSNNPVTLVPDYRSTYARTPVTYYRPVLTTDPNTGSQVVTLSPCTSYEYQTQRVPTWGLTQVYNGGATLPAVAPTAPIVSPTISLPRGGIPLSGPVPATQPYATAYGAYSATMPSTLSSVAPTNGSIITPASPNTFSPPAPYTSGYSSYASNYGNYSTLQPGAVLPPNSTYTTQPVSPYYGSGVSGSIGTGCTGGGSTGSYSAPPASTYSHAPYSGNPYATSPTVGNPTLSTPSLSTPTFGSAAPAPGISNQVLPGQSVPNYPSLPNAPANVTPGFPSAPSTDPAASAVPNLQGSNLRSDSKPQLQNIVQQPTPSNRSFSATPSPGPAPESKPKLDSNQGLLPIPIPDDFQHEPRWNPGLLKEKDTTAAVERATDPHIAWGSKPIRWASHKTTTGKTMPDPQLPPAQLRDRPKAEFKPPVTEIPEINFQPIPPARLELDRR